MPEGRAQVFIRPCVSSCKARRRAAAKHFNRDRQPWLTVPVDRATVTRPTGQPEGATGPRLTGQPERATGPRSAGQPGNRNGQPGHGQPRATGTGNRATAGQPGRPTVHGQEHGRPANRVGQEHGRPADGTGQPCTARNTVGRPTGSANRARPGTRSAGQPGRPTVHGQEHGRPATAAPSPLHPPTRFYFLAG